MLAKLAKKGRNILFLMWFALFVIDYVTGQFVAADHVDFKTLMFMQLNDLMRFGMIVMLFLTYMSTERENEELIKKLEEEKLKH